MSKQTTTDFREKIMAAMFMSTHKQIEEKILSAVSELVEESFERLLKDGHGGGNWRRLIELERERFKERGIEIK